ncbi:hypothetical protein D8Y22_15575 [Salinadaptatus halalkaliphilus]|uniref:Uncharacterized protein n=1 Tax=Salinadaptatus halalkaliphilus TaxID=2419781 RepID=A0A4V3VL19_9EURY|nr:hypothetical protein D8Y22_15575 [Salinadaptatus halalkaliphilus]
MNELSESVETTSSATSFLGRLAALAVLVGVGYVLRPFFHGPVYAMVYSPGGAIVLGLTGIAAIALFLQPRFGDDLIDSIATKGRIVGFVFAVSLVLALLVGIPAGMLEQRTMAEQTMDEAVELEEFPEVNEDNARVITRDVSDVQTRGSVSYRQHRLGDSDIARMEDGSLAWSYAIEPDDLRNRLIEHQRGVVMNEMTNIDTRTTETVDDQEFTYGEGMALHRSADWNMKQGHFWSQYNDDPVEFIHDGDAYMYYPKTGHEWHFSPIPHTTPTWDGGALVHTDGTIEHLSPEETQDHPVLEGQRLYPLDVSEREMQSLGYRNGIVNQMDVIGAHEDQVEVAGMPSGAGNSQPFVVDLEGEQLSYVTAMEPYGEDTRGLDEVWFVDATTGEFEYYGTGGDTLTGAERAMGIVRSEDTQTGWGDDFEVVEPIPVTVDDELWWHSKVVPIDNTDVSRNVFVNAHSGDAVEVHGDDAIAEFLAGDDPDEVAEVGDVDQEPAPDEPAVDYYVVIYDEDGDELERIPIEPGQDVSLVSETE